MLRDVKQICRACNETLPVAAFYKKGTLHKKCHACRADQARRLLAERRLTTPVGRRARVKVR